jgi:integrase
MCFLKYVETLAINSQDKYKRVAKEYLEFCEDSGKNPDDVGIVREFLTFLRNDDDSDYCASTLWTICSIVCTWLRCEHKIEASVADPLLSKTLKNWTKQDEKKKAPTFTEAMINKLLNDGSEDQLVHQVVFILGIYGFLRRSEVANMTFEDITININSIEGKVYRQKQAGPKRQSSFLITDAKSRQIMVKYFSKFEEGVRV